MLHGRRLFAVYAGALGLIAVAFAAMFWAVLHTGFHGAPRHRRTVAVVPVSFGDLPGWYSADVRAGLQAFVRSCAILKMKPDATPMGKDGYAGAVKDWKSVCEAAGSAAIDAAAARRFFQKSFVPLEIRPSQVLPLFTGYYEPLIHASRTHQAAYQVPIYAPPDNLVSADLGLFRADLSGERIYGCLENRQLLRCPTRAEINNHPAASLKPLLYADDSIAVFFLHIQGSGRAQLQDGTEIRLAYAGQNGRPYTAIGRTLVDHHFLDRRRLSMQAIRDWMKVHPREAKAVMETDESFVFFSEKPIGDAALGSSGSEGVPLTPLGSAAVDPRIHPLGVPVYLSASIPMDSGSGPGKSFNRLLIAQDSGGAIRGPARADIFWGFGPEAESMAGRMKSSGRFFILLPRAVAARLGSESALEVT
jgi:membrane-bound lytic murein transglycosylase A